MSNYPNFYHLKNPCVVDVDTEIGMVSLMMDKDYPSYVFVSINGEMRKCIDISESVQIQFESNKQVKEYLNYFQYTRDFAEIVEIEKSMDQGWMQL